MLEEARTVAKEAKGKHSSVKSPKIEEGHLRVIVVDKAKDMVDGLGGNFSYYELGPVLLLPDGNLNEEVGPQKIREYVYYMETKEPLPAEQPPDEPYFMGLCRNTAYYFYYERESVTTLDHAFWLPSRQKPRATPSMLTYAPSRRRPCASITSPLRKFLGTLPGCKGA